MKFSRLPEDPGHGQAGADRVGDDGSSQVVPGQWPGLAMNPGDQGELVIDIIVEGIVDGFIRLGQSKLIVPPDWEKRRDVELLVSMQAQSAINHFGALRI